MTNESLDFQYENLVWDDAITQLQGCFLSAFIKNLFMAEKCIPHKSRLCEYALLLFLFPLHSDLNNASLGCNAQGLRTDCRSWPGDALKKQVRLMVLKNKYKLLKDFIADLMHTMETFKT